MKFAAGEYSDRLLVFSFTLVVGIMFFGATAFAAKIGDKGTAMWKGKSYPAEITKKKGDQCYVHWTGYGKNWDEWQPCAALTITDSNAKVAVAPEATPAYNVGDAVSVNWKGSWYPARVIAINKNKNTFKIHYDNYESSWDEWVGTSRIKK